MLPPRLLARVPDRYQEDATGSGAVRDATSSTTGRDADAGSNIVSDSGPTSGWDRSGADVTDAGGE